MADPRLPAPTFDFDSLVYSQAVVNVLAFAPEPPTLVEGNGGNENGYNANFFPGGWG